MARIHAAIPQDPKRGIPLNLIEMARSLGPDMPEQRVLRRRNKPSHFYNETEMARRIGVRG